MKIKNISAETKEAFKEIAAILQRVRSNDPETWQFETGILKPITSKVIESGWFHPKINDIDAVLMALSEMDFE